MLLIASQVCHINPAPGPISLQRGGAPDRRAPRAATQRAPHPPLHNARTGGGKLFQLPATANQCSEYQTVLGYLRPAKITAPLLFKI